MGCLSLLARPTLALFCSVKCTGTLILETFEFARRLGPSGPVVISGFHSPMERQCLEVLLVRKVPVVICPARGLGRFRVRSEWNRAAAEGNVLVASPFDPRQRRATTELSLQRNRFVAALADQILVPYAAPGGKMEGFVREIAAWGKPIVTFRCEDNRLLSELGAREISEGFWEGYTVAGDALGLMEKSDGPGHNDSCCDAKDVSLFASSSERHRTLTAMPLGCFEERAMRRGH